MINIFIINDQDQLGTIHTLIVTILLNYISLQYHPYVCFHKAAPLRAIKTLERFLRHGGVRVNCSVHSRDLFQLKMCQCASVSTAREAARLFKFWPTFLPQHIQYDIPLPYLKLNTTGALTHLGNHQRMHIAHYIFLMQSWKTLKMLLLLVNMSLLYVKPVIRLQCIIFIVAKLHCNSEKKKRTSALL